MKKLLKTLLFLTINFFLIALFGSNISAQYDPDYPESLGSSLGVYKINSNSKIPEEFNDFEYFYLDKFPN